MVGGLRKRATTSVLCTTARRWPDASTSEAETSYRPPGISRKITSAIVGLFSRFNGISLLRRIPAPSAMIVSIRFAESGSKAAPMRIYGVTLCTGVADSVSGSFTAAESAGSKRPQTERAFIACPLPQHVDDHAAVNSVPVAVVSPEEVRRVVLAPDVGKPVITAKSPPVVGRVPLQAAADVARQE